MTKAMGLRCSGPATAENRAHQRQKQDISRFSGQQDDLEMMDTLAKSSSWIKNPETRKEHWALMCLIGSDKQCSGCEKKISLAADPCLPVC